MKVFKTSFWLAFILSLGYMAWRAVANKGLVCGYIEVGACGTISWLSQLGLMFVALLVIFIIVFGLLTKKRTRFGFIRGRLGEKLEKGKKLHKELGAAEVHQLHMTKKLRKGRIKI